MSKEQNIKSFTAADIERYHRGLMSSKERHALEKAALDDPFLADALEGYGMTSVNMNEDIAELRKRIANRTEKAEITTVLPARASSFAWWKVAAMIVFVVGAAFLVYQIGFVKTSTNIAQAPKDNSAATKTTDSVTTSIPSPGVSDSSIPADLANSNANNKKIVPGSQSISSKDTKRELAGAKKDVDADGADDALDKEVQKSAPLEITEGFAKNTDAKAVNPVPNQEEPKLKSLRNDNAFDRSSPQFKTIETKKNAAGNATRQNQGYVNQSNVFRGRVTDNNNNALPFSNITNLQDTIGTYSDARGYFVLTSPDSVLNVQIRSLGFETSNVQLNHLSQENKIQLEDDRSLSANVLDTVKRNTNRARMSTMTLEEPEPADGWNNYDTYLANNLKMPESFKSRQNGGAVELAFEVDKNGVPYNITVKKSLCESCDKEAIRLIKEGPKWKRKGKKEKATVTVSF